MEREEIYRITNSGKVIPNGELIRCKDCKHWKLTSCPVTEHKLGYMPPDWFCADGERKEGEVNENNTIMETE